MAKIYTALNKEEEIVDEDSRKINSYFAVFDLRHSINLSFLENALDKSIFLLYNKLVAKKKRADLIEISTLDGSCEPYLIVTN